MSCVKFDSTIDFFDSSQWFFDSQCVYDANAENILRDTPIDLWIYYNFQSMSVITDDVAICSPVKLHQFNFYSVSSITGIIEFDKNIVTLSSYLTSIIR